MELKSFKIRNFRGIKNARCVLSPKITVLAGKNESGKTTILQALEALNEGWEFQETDRPHNTEGEKRFSLTCNFTINDEEKKSLLSELGLDYSIKSNEVVIKKSNEDPKYVVTGDFVNSILDENSVSEEEVIIFRSQLDLLNNSLAIQGVPIKVDDVENFKTEDESIQQVRARINSVMPWISQKKPGIAQEIQPLIDVISNILNSMDAVEEASQKVIDKVVELVPKIVLFSSFGDELPSEMPVAEFLAKDTLRSKYRIVDDFISLSNLDREKFATADKIQRANLASRASRITSDSFGKHWNQGEVELSFRAEGDSVLFIVQDKGKEALLQPKQRSKGFQWYMAFFLRLTAEGKTSNIILIDEPGLYLHAKAQEDVLGVLEELSENNQIIFSTHSPYLIDANKLGRLRLTENNEKTEQIEIRDYNAKAELETLTPIITAIGLDITKGLAFPNKKNIIIEGVSDYFYIQGMLDYLKRKERYAFPDDLVFIPCVGNTNVGTVTSLLHGYGLNYKILLDKKGSLKTKNALIRDGIQEERIIDVGKKESDSIEDLFAEKDQKQFNIQNKEKSKKIISRNFNEQITNKKSKIILSENTVNNFRRLLDVIKTDIGSPIDQLEEKLNEMEETWENVVELLAVTYSIPLNSETRKEVIKKYVRKIKSIAELTSKQQGEIFNQVLQELGIKITK